jgi:hypothetical protein
MDLQNKMTELSNSLNGKNKEEIDLLDMTYDLYMKVKSSSNFAFNYKSYFSFLSTLIIPLLGLIVSLLK